jgi:FkbM family methyltransferase
MTFTSYAQNFEDVMLWRALKHVEHGFYIDVGANDPAVDSVTLAFYERGWRGINIEPMQQYYAKLCASRPEDVNLAVAVADSVGELSFFDVPDTGLSTIDAEVARHHAEAGRQVIEQKVRVTTLTDVCNVHAPGQIHFLKIDVEGFEKPVLQGMDFKRWRPWILVIEATRPQSTETVHEEWENLVTGAGYRFAYFDGLNHYYVADEHPELAAAFNAPPNVFDDFVLRTGHAFSYPLAEFHERVARADARAARAETRAGQAEARIEEEKARADLAENRARHESERAQVAEEALHRTHRALQDVYASTSWRVTGPLRWAKRVASGSKSRLRHALAAAIALPRRAVLGSLRRLVRLLKRSRFALRLAERIQRRYPDAWEHVMRRLRTPLPSDTAAAVEASSLALDDAPSDAPFEAMLTRELQRRQNKKLSRPS